MIFDLKHLLVSLIVLVVMMLTVHLNIDLKDKYFYLECGTNWYELDRVDERIHGSTRFEATDDVSPHDPDVFDAPEDIKRVGNDHEELHNANCSQMATIRATSIRMTTEIIPESKLLESTFPVTQTTLVVAKTTLKVAKTTIGCGLNHQAKKP